MTKRAVIITTSILVGLIATLTILFGMVFRVRNIDVVCSDNFRYQQQLTDILSTSKLNKNDSIFGINRDKIASNIEQAYPYARVEGVNIKSFISVKIKLSNREPIYYLVEDAVYYILDEDCKVLEITDDVTKAEKYILLDNVFSVSESTKAGQFLSNKYTKMCKDAYNSLYMYVGEDADGDGVLDKANITREDIYTIVRSVKFNKTNELFGEVDQLIMATSYGTKISIVEPQKDMGLKVNMAFSALRTLVKNDNANGTELSTKGSIVIRYSYNDNNVPTPVCEYHV